jgi:hypothetical protein
VIVHCTSAALMKPLSLSGASLHQSWVSLFASFVPFAAILSGADDSVDRLTLGRSLDLA